MTDPFKILNKRSATKGELRAALAEALFEPLPQWAEVEENLTGKCRKYFADAFAQATGLAYNFQPKDHKALGALVGKIADAATAKKPDATSRDIFAAFTFFIDHLPQWYREGGFSLCIINSKFNEIIAQMKNGKGNEKGSTGTGVSDAYAAAVLQGLH